MSPASKPFALGAAGPALLGAARAQPTVDAAARLEGEALALLDDVGESDRLDPLTGLVDRTVVLREISRHLATGDPFSVLFVGLDRFRAVNELHGYPVGDEVLRQVARRLQQATHACDTVARVGSDEFAVIVHGVDDVSARGLVGQLERSLSEVFRVGSGSVRVGVSIGACDATPGWSPEHVMADAEAAMREAKAVRRSGAQPPGLSRRMSQEDRSRLVDECRTGLLRHQFIAHFQPIIDIAARRLVRVEALVRWQHPRLGLLRPEAFMGPIEAMGYESELGTSVLESSAEALVRLARSGLRPDLALKFSAGQLADPTIGRRVVSTLAASDVDVSRLVIEISDRSLQGGSSLVGAVAPEDSLIEFQHRGAALCLGNFGSGASSFANVRRYPLAEIKVDRAIVSEICVSAPDRALADLILRFGRELGLVVGAEGVETAEQLAALSALGYDQAQGYFVGVPMSVDELVLWSWS
jgi:diguanylate cyclase (GGDEF)-like protein